MKHFLILFSLLLAFSSPLQAQTPGTLDTSFGGGDGIVLLESVRFPDQIGAQRGAIQSDGKIVTVGSLSAPPSGSTGIVRFLSNGAMDTSFSEDGISTTVSGGRFSLAIQPDGKSLLSNC